MMDALVIGLVILPIAFILDGINGLREWWRAR